MRKYLKVFILFLFVWIIGTVNSNAKVISNDPTVNSGGTVSITIKSDEAVKAFKSNISNSGGLTFISAKMEDFLGEPNGDNASGASIQGANKLITYTFSVPTVTQDTVYSVQFSVSTNADGEPTSWKSFTNTSKVTVKAPEAPKTEEPKADEPDDGLTTGGTGGTTTTVKSSNNYLKSLKLSTGSISFNKKTVNYTVNVAEDVENITITATAEHEKAKVSGAGKINLIKGTNTAKVVVTAENGSARTYTLTIIRAGEEEEKTEEEVPAEETPTEEIIGLTSLSLKGIKDNGDVLDLEFSPEFATDIFYYSCEVPGDINMIDVDSSCDILDAIIEITGNENLQEGENLINIIIKYKTEDGEEKTVTYQIEVNKLASVAQAIEEEEPSGINKLAIVFLSVAVICVIIAIILIVRYKKQDKQLWEETEFGTYGKPLYDENEPEQELELEQEVVESSEEQQERQESNEVVDIAEEENKRDRKKKKGKHF